VVRAPELGSIRAVSAHLALTETGVLLAATVDDNGVIALPIEWTEVTSSEPLVRLASSGAFGASGLWLRETGSAFSSCMQSPALVAGTPPLDALDVNGTAYSRQAMPPDNEYHPCKWPAPFEGTVLGESHVGCGIAQNWMVLTPQRIMAMNGMPFCAID
jgi:hypothetical protein